MSTLRMQLCSHKVQRSCQTIDQINDCKYWKKSWALPSRNRSPETLGNLLVPSVGRLFLMWRVFLTVTAMTMISAKRSASIPAMRTVNWWSTYYLKWWGKNYASTTIISIRRNLTVMGSYLHCDHALLETPDNSARNHIRWRPWTSHERTHTSRQNQGV